MPEKQCRSKKENKLRGDPLQRLYQFWSRHQQAIRISFHWRIEDGLILKYKNQRTNLVTRCRSSLLIYFDIEKLVEKKMLELLIRIIEKCKEKLSKDSRYWPNEAKQDLKMAPRWSAQMWIDVLAKGGGQKKRFQCCLKPDEPERLLYLWAIEGHSGRNLNDPSLQDSVIIPDGFFKYIYHVGCAINLHSIISSGLIPGGHSLSKKQTVFFLLFDPMDKNHKDPDTIDLEAPRLAQYMHKAWKKHQNTVYWVDIDLAIRKDDHRIQSDYKCKSGL